MRSWLPFILTLCLATAIGLGFMVFARTPAHCSACIGQFCGVSDECPVGCFCARDDPSAPTGRCLSP